jgi:hypothetical protein
MLEKPALERTRVFLKRPLVKSAVIGDRLFYLDFLRTSF